MIINIITPRLTLLRSTTRLDPYGMLSRFTRRGMGGRSCFPLSRTPRPGTSTSRGDSLFRSPHRSLALRWFCFHCHPGGDSYHRGTKYR